MTIHYRVQGSLIVVFGNTYPVKLEIKNLGGRFEGVGKTWRIPLSDENLAQVNVLCQSRGGGPLEPLPREPAPSVESLPFEAAAVTLQRTLLATSERDLQTSQGEESPVARALTVRQLLDKAYRVIQNSFTESFWIIGELQNLSSKASGMFFDLAEAKDGEEETPRVYEQRSKGLPAANLPRAVSSGTLTIRCVLWREAFQAIVQRRGQEASASALQDGLKVALRCRVQFYRDRAQVSLVVEDLDPSYTKGALALQREKLLAELRAKGLDRANGKLDFPVFPFDVGLISAEGSRAYSDFTHQLESLGFPGRVWFVPSPMQGEGVPEGVVKALKDLCDQKVDVIVITRGGGSAADLRWFDDPKIAYAIAQATVPVIAAIGHHDDRCVAEEVCYQRQKTPTAAADFLVGCFEGARRRIEDASHQLIRGMTRRRDGFAEETARLGEKIGTLAARALENRKTHWLQLQNQMQRRCVDLLNHAHGVVQQQKNTLYLRASQQITRQKEQLSDWQQRLVQKDPRPWMEQGWTQLTTVQGQNVTRLDQASAGQRLKARLLDGVLDLEVKGHVSRKTPESTRDP